MGGGGGVEEGDVKTTSCVWLETSGGLSKFSGDPPDLGGEDCKVKEKQKLFDIFTF